MQGQDMSNHPFTILNANGQGDLVLICDHASNHIPPEYDNLGLEQELLKQHIAYDIGAAELTRNLSQIFDAPALLADFSRLLVDVNRTPDSPTLCPQVSDGIDIPGNQDINNAELQTRLDRFYHPYHDAAGLLVLKKKQQGRVPLVLGIHSYTPIMNDTPRPWHAGMLWDKDPRLAMALIEALENHGYHVGDNEPYSGRELFYTMDRHGAAHGFPQVTVEIRQDEIDHAQGISKWTAIMADVLKEALRHPELAIARKYSPQE
ncbi:MAG: N-formylglutamate amidohydrolase [Kordiimonas sp.]|nr:N-formylglutamate amidohydrolase [Kordiimonas sp.]